MLQCILYFSLFLSSCCFCIAQPLTKIHNLVFEGAGVRGLSYVGALMELKNRNMLDSIKRVGGTSAGAITAALIAIGYSPEEIMDLISDMNIKCFADGGGIFIGGTKRLLRNYGWYKGNKFTKWLQQVIKTKTNKENLTFAQLYELSKQNSNFKQLFITATNLSKQTEAILSHETFPDMEICTAVRISIGIPLFFEAVVIDTQGKIIKKKKDRIQGNFMVDGGILNNFPIHIFDHPQYMDSENNITKTANTQTIGFRLDSEQQIEYDKNNTGLAPYDIKCFKNFVKAFYVVVMENLNRQLLTPEDWARTISINTSGISPRIKRLSDEDKTILVENGRIATAGYFQK